MKNIILFGPPGSGKGTQAIKLAERFELVHISTGDLFRHELGNNTPLGQKARFYMDQGKLVPDEVTVAMLKNRMTEFPDANGFILDGFPRTIAQAEALDNLLKEQGTSVSMLVSLTVNEEEIVSRLLKRGEVSGRADDANEEVIRKRIAVYHEETSPVLSYYNEQSLVREVEGIGEIDEINDRISKVIESA